MLLKARVEPSEMKDKNMEMAAVIAIVFTGIRVFGWS
jgi:hypothetical protein